MIRDVLHFPDRRLKTPADPVGEFTPEIRSLIDDLVETTAATAHTVGLAAPQLGEMWRVCVVDCSGHKRVPDAQGLLVLVNPVVIESEGAEIGREGCLSLPNITANVRRAKTIAVRALDAEGNERIVRASAFEARAILHEIDHLDGILILDRVASLTLDVFARKQRRS